MSWEQHLQADVHAQHAALQQQHQQRLWSLTHELQEQEQMAASQLRAEQDARLNSLRLELQVSHLTASTEWVQWHAVPAFQGTIGVLTLLTLVKTKQLARVQCVISIPLLHSQLSE